MPPTETRHLSGPGQLEESIRTASKLPGAEKASFDPSKLNNKERRQLNEALETIFGTPASPRVEIASEAVNDLSLDPKALRRGSLHYRRHCLHCHGLAGDGRGPTGPWISPHPRDYRSGVFKFISTSPDLGGYKARRADLLRTLRVGIDGTSMPSFALLPETELEDLVSYVIHLSIRGETELKTIFGTLAPPINAIDSAKKKIDNPSNDKDREGGGEGTREG